MKKIVNVPAVGVAGLITCEAVKDSKVVRSTPKFFNLVLDQGLNFLGNDTTTFLRCCQAGTGNTVPIISDVGLDSQIAGTIIDESAYAQLNTTDKYMYISCTYTFPAGSATGNIAEIGIGTETSGNALFSRSLVKDGAGDPTTITILPDEQLRVTYEYRVYQPQSDIFNDTVNSYAIIGRTALSSTISYTEAWYTQQTTSTATEYRNCFTIRPGSVGGRVLVTTGDVGEITDSITGTDIVGAKYLSEFGSQSVYVPGSFYRDLSLHFDADEANHALGVGAIQIAYGPTCFQYSFTPNIMKTELDILDIVFRYSWARKTL